MSKTRIAAYLGGALLGLTLAACGTDTTPDPAPTKYATITPGPDKKATATAAPAKTARQLTTEQRNAARAAQNYLEGESGFSRKELIGQLKYNDFTTEAATVGVDSLNVDWNAQAALAAQGYLDSQGFSRAGLVKQLKYSGFTSEQAAYGVKQAGL